MSLERVPPTQVTIDTGAREIDQQRLHKYLGCGHSVEKDNCLFPPRHIEANVLVNSKDSYTVRYRGKCNNCQENEILKETGEGIKEQIREIVNGQLNMQYMTSPTRVEVRRLDKDEQVPGAGKLGKRGMLLASYHYKEKRGQDEFDENRYALLYLPRKLDGTKWHNWDEDFMHMTFASQVATQKIRTDIHSRLKDYEFKWNEYNPKNLPSPLATKADDNSSRNSSEDDIFDEITEAEAREISLRFENASPVTGP
ncbi:hypothetical protein BGW36DRAFT_356309 [Talaromyces proteolyticus]|uniref:Uncharacterized protein n=1 Tax=Talaromyces proteolyticus TaxID=1131652 RepID=A0AAD4Q3U7_9EURO|nr:uncharacterized protein BGW36DRAFT_356309 [Talaromyces proteolyticus]KAH8702173.1 hypothetical protein BGW36DRAFT_356309 [Talaromyces proteolyticus]